MVASTVCNFFVVFRDFSSRFNSMFAIKTLKRLAGFFIVGHSISLQYLVDKEQSMGKIYWFRNKLSNFNAEVN